MTANPGSIDLGHGPLVLLFYDGFECRAEPEFMRSVYARARAGARFAYRTLKGLQAHTGFYVAFRLLVAALQKAGCDVRVNDFALTRKYPAYPIGLSGYPSVLSKVELPNPAIFGPGDYGHPDAAAPLLDEGRIKTFIQPSEWAASLYGDTFAPRMMSWPVGIDTEACPDLSGCPKDVDFVVYDKIRWHRETEASRVLGTLVSALGDRGLSYRMLRYGRHRHRVYMDHLRRARALLFVCEHETQGLAYQEALASNLPVLAWDEGLLVDPLQRRFATARTRVSSVPYFDQRCGERFRLSEFAPRLDLFLSRFSSYAPRAYVLENLSMARSARAYLDAYFKLARSGERIAI